MEYKLDSRFIRGGGILTDPPGSGKTVEVSLAAMAQAFEFDNNARFAVVVPVPSR